jgi:hypothetical protein
LTIPIDEGKEFSGFSTIGELEKLQISINFQSKTTFSDVFFNQFYLDDSENVVFNRIAIGLPSDWNLLFPEGPIEELGLHRAEEIFGTFSRIVREFTTYIRGI